MCDDHVLSSARTLGSVGSCDQSDPKQSIAHEICLNKSDVSVRISPVSEVPEQLNMHALDRPLYSLLTPCQTRSHVTKPFSSMKSSKTHTEFCRRLQCTVSSEQADSAYK